MLSLLADAVAIAIQFSITSYFRAGCLAGATEHKTRPRSETFPRFANNAAYNRTPLRAGIFFGSGLSPVVSSRKEGVYVCGQFRDRGIIVVSTLADDVVNQ